MVSSVRWAKNISPGAYDRESPGLVDDYQRRAWSGALHHFLFEFVVRLEQYFEEIGGWMTAIFFQTPYFALFWFEQGTFEPRLRNHRYFLLENLIVSGAQISYVDPTVFSKP